jgi:hypothetical protein
MSKDNKQRYINLYKQLFQFENFNKVIVILFLYIFSRSYEKLFIE